MKAGNLKHRVALQSKSTTVDSFGARTPAWTTEEVVWAHVAPLSGQERVFASQVDPTITHTVRMRYGSVDNIDSSWRILWGTRVLNIKSVYDENEGHSLLSLMCVEDV